MLVCPNCDRWDGSHSLRCVLDGLDGPTFDDLPEGDTETQPEEFRNDSPRRGRPRLYASEADRQRAYRERRKVKAGK